MQWNTRIIELFIVNIFLIFFRLKKEIGAEEKRKIYKNDEISSAVYYYYFGLRDIFNTLR